MNISELSIRRPVLSTVLTLIILLFGFIGYNYLGVRSEYPSWTIPSFPYPAPTPSKAPTLLKTRLQNRWSRISTVSPAFVHSSVSQQGSSRITVVELSVDLETAANDVRDKVSRAQRRYLPRTATRHRIQSRCRRHAYPLVALQRTNARCWNQRNTTSP